MAENGGSSSKNPGIYEEPVPRHLRTSYLSSDAGGDATAAEGEGADSAEPTRPNPLSDGYATARAATNAAAAVQATVPPSGGAGGYAAARAPPTAAAAGATADLAAPVVPPAAAPASTKGAITDRDLQTYDSIKFASLDGARPASSPPLGKTAGSTSAVILSSPFNHQYEYIDNENGSESPPLSPALGPGSVIDQEKANEAMARRQTRRRPSRPPPPTRYRAPTEQAYGVAPRTNTVTGKTASGLTGSSNYAVAEVYPRSSTETSGGSMAGTLTQRRVHPQTTRRRGRGRPTSLYDAIGAGADNTDSEPDDPAAAATVADPPTAAQGTEGGLYAEAEAAPGTVPKIFARSKSRGTHAFVISKSMINSDGQLDQVLVSETERAIMKKSGSAPASAIPIAGAEPRKGTMSRRKTQAKIDGDKQTRLNTCSVHTSNVLASTVQLEKSGNLLRQSGKLRAWKGRWCVLSNDRFTFFKDQKAEDAGKAPLGVIEFDVFVSVRITAGDDPRFTILTSEGTHDFQASSAVERAAWTKAITSNLTLLQVSKSRAVMLEGWLTKSRNGHSKRRWCSLMGRTLYYAKSEFSRPIGSLNVMQAMIQTDMVDSDNEEEAPSSAGTSSVATSREPPAVPGPGNGLDGGQNINGSLCFSVTTRRGNHFFLAQTAEEFKKWGFFLQLASGKVPTESCSPTEQVLKGLVENQGATDEQIMNHPGLASSVLAFSKDTLLAPLTTLPTSDIEKLALELDKSIQMFTTIQVKREAVAYHLRLAQDIVKRCMETPAVQNEVFCQLIRHTHRHPYPNSATALQCWQLLILIIPICLPTAFFLTYLELHLKRCSAGGSGTAQMAALALTSLDAAMARGPRALPPSLPEVLSVIQRTGGSTSNRHLMSIKVLLSTGSEYLVGFSPSSTCQDVCDSICAGLTMRPARECGFALFASDPRFPETEIHHSLKAGTMLCDVMYGYERALREVSVGHVDNLSIPQLYLRRRVYFKATECTHEVENILIAYQVNNDVAAGKFHVASETTMVAMAALMAQLEWGDFDDQEDPTEQYAHFERFLPPAKQAAWSSDRSKSTNGKMLFKLSEDKAALTQKIVTYWRSLNQKLAWSLGRSYVDEAKKVWEFYGANIFPAKLRESGLDIWIAVHEKGVSVLSHKSFEQVDSIPYSTLKNFGSGDGARRPPPTELPGSDAVKTAPVKTTFQLSRKDGVNIILNLCAAGTEADVAFTIASYINAIVRREGIRSTLASINHVLSDHETNMVGSGTNGKSLGSRLDGRLDSDA